VVQSDTLAGKIAQVTEYNMALVDAQATYFWWYEGLRLDTDGTPAFGVAGCGGQAGQERVSVFCAIRVVREERIEALSSSIPTPDACTEPALACWNPVGTVRWHLPSNPSQRLRTPLKGHGGWGTP